MKNPIFGFLIVVLLIPLAYAGKPPVFADDDGAIRGYDPVAYFIIGAPTKGNNEYTAEWQGETFKFANAGNLKLFKDDPAKYAPQYGGYCAYAVSKDATASTVPEAWTIADGKLYLNYSLDVRKRWRQDIPGHTAAADKNWPGVLE